MGWYPMLYTAAKENFIQIGGHTSVEEAPISNFLYFINFYKKKCDLDNARISKQYNTKS